MSSYYEILEIERNATPEDIRRAYKRLSLKYHPDRNPAPHAHSKMQDINKAFEVLSDTEKRREYDFINGMDGVGRAAEGHSFQRNFFRHSNNTMGGEDGFADINNIFQMFFQTHHFQTHPNMHKPPPIVVNIEISLAKAFVGGEYAVEIEKKIITPNNEVNGMKEKLTFQLPIGIRDGTILQLENRGNQVNNVHGDVKIIVHVLKDPLFERIDGLDLLMNQHLSLKEALCGFHLEFTHLNGNLYNFSQCHTIINPNTRLCLDKLGMRDEHGNIGNLNILFKIRFPSELEEPKKTLLRDIL